ncbi:MFS transporter [Dictyobacter aurantiacus]|nr:MFS transporter [Dictyobacter aurantiacus]
MPASPLYTRNFLLFWLGQSISQLGDAIIEVTIPVWVGLLSNDPSHVALVTATEVLPSLCLSPFAGAIADRWRPRSLMMICDLLRGALIGSLLLVPPTILSWYLYLVSCAVAALGSFFSPARNVALHLVVEEGEMLRAQALVRSTQSLALLLGPVLGAGLLLFSGPMAGLLCDALSFGIGAVTLLFIHIEHVRTSLPTLSPSPAWRRIQHDIADGLRFALRDRLLLIILVVSSVTTLIGSLWYAVDVFFVQSSLKVPKAGVGLLWTISGTGGLVGGLLVLRMSKKLRQENMLLMGLSLKGASLLWYALMTSYVWAIPAAFLAGLGENWLLVSLLSLMMEQTRKDMLGRVTALQDTISALSTLLALIVMTLLQKWIAPWQVLLLCGLALCLLSIGTTWGFKVSGHIPSSDFPSNIL